MRDKTLFPGHRIPTGAGESSSRRRPIQFFLRIPPAIKKFRCFLP
jgi:hypothetical protein